MNQTLAPPPVLGDTPPPKRLKVAIFTSHPIQYQAPWFQALAGQDDLDVCVYFSRVPNETQQGAGFGGAFRWDIDLRAGYRNIVLAETTAPFGPAFTRNIVRGLGKALDARRPDVALILGWHDITLVQAYLACRKRGVPIVMRGESNALRRRSPAIGLLHKAYFTGVDAALAIGASNREFCRQAGLSDERIVMAPYFVDNARFAHAASEVRPQRSALRARWAIGEDAFCVLFAGKLEAKKRIHDVLYAIDSAKRAGAKVHALVVGTGADMDGARAFAEQRGAPVTFAGFLNQTQMASAYAAADALVLPSDYGETWGLVVNEAMASGLPAIVSERVGCANDLVIDGQTGAVSPFADTAAIAAIVAAWSSDRALALRLGEQARLRVNGAYTIANAVAGFRRAAAIALSHATAPA